MSNYPEWFLEAFKAAIARALASVDRQGPGVGRGKDGSMKDDLNHLSHSDDPETSREAIENLESSGIRATHAEMVLQAVREHPGRTGSEIAKALGLELYQVRRRLSDLKAAGRVQHGEIRACEVNGTRMATWVLPGQGEVRQGNLFE